MTVRELREALAGHSDEDEVPIVAYQDHLSHIVDALEQWQAIGETFGRHSSDEVRQFLEEARECL